MNEVQRAYLSRIESLEEQKSLALKRSKHLMWFRLLSFVAAVAVLFVLFPVSVVAATVGSLLLLALFAVFAIRDLKNQRHITYLDNLIAINKDEIACIEGNFAAFDSGQEFFDIKHPYSHDLDIFGSQSIYQMLCRATTMHGKAALANRLRTPLPYNELNKNQQAVNELSEMQDWRLNFFEIGKSYSTQKHSIEEAISWMQSKEPVLDSLTLKLAVNILPPITISLAILWCFNIAPGAFILAILLHLLVYGKYGRAIGVLQDRVSKANNELKSFSSLLSMAENTSFTSDKLKELAEKVALNNKQASQIMAKLSSLVEKLDYRLNFLFMISLGLFLFWDFRIAYKMNKWKNCYAELAPKWIDTVGELEALSSLATLKYNNPTWTFANVSNTYFELNAKAIAHPLIPSERRVANTFNLINNEKVVLLTGSNMAGKSTFLRTLGVNMVLAYAGAPTCSEYLSVGYSPIRTSMRISDSLTENTSSFYAEIKRLGEIVAAIQNGEKPFLLLDEILRGTNSHYRHTGSKALINFLVEHVSFGIIATHDIALSEEQRKYPSTIANYHFDVQVDSNDELYFDYKIKAGVCQSLNASILMRKIGLDV